MFALTAASIGAAMFAFAATAASTGAARSSPRSTFASRSSSDDGPVSAGSGAGAGSSAASPCPIVESWVEFAIASASMFCDSSESWLADASDWAPGDSVFALTAASIGSAAFALAATPALIGAAASRSASRSTSRSSSEVPPIESSRSPAVSPTRRRCRPRPRG